MYFNFQYEFDCLTATGERILTYSHLTTPFIFHQLPLPLSATLRMEEGTAAVLQLGGGCCVKSDGARARTSAARTKVQMLSLRPKIFKTATPDRYDHRRCLMVGSREEREGRVVGCKNYNHSYLHPAFKLPTHTHTHTHIHPRYR